MEYLFDTAQVPPERRFAQWRAALGALLDIQARDGRPDDETFHGRLAVRRIDRIRLTEIAGAPMSLSAGPRRADSEVTVLALLDGRATVMQGERRCELSRTAIALVSSDDPIELDFHAASHVIALNTPQREFYDLFPRARHSLLTAIPGAAAAPALFIEHSRALARHAISLDSPSARVVADSMVHLAGAVANSAPENGARYSALSRASIQRVLAAATRHLRNPDLDVHLIARAVHLSPRQIHRLFLTEPLSLMRWVLIRRLENCRHELLQPDADMRPISAIAYEWGFNDSAHFSRSFRKYFGESPREARRRSTAVIQREAATVRAESPFDAPQCRACRFWSSRTSQ